MMENEDISPEEEALMMEAQLVQANTEYRRLSDDYTNYKIQMHKKICHFNDAIKVLDGERLEFDMLLGKGRDPNLMKRSKKSKDVLDEIVRQTKCTTTEILAELESLRRDNIMVDETEDELWKLRQEIGGPTVIFKRRIQQQRMIEKLKNRRQMMTARLGTAMMKNKFHRARIEDLRAMRLAFDQIFTRVRREIDFCKKKKFDLILKANHALEEKEEYQSVIKVLKEKNEKDQAQYEQTMRVMKRNKRGDEKICDFLGAKLNERLELKEEEEKKRINEITTALEADTKTLNVYKEAFECIQEVSEEKEVKEMVKNYSQKEAENFALFNYITGLNGQVEALQEELANVRKEIEELAEEEVSLTREHEETMRNLEVKYDILMDDLNRCNEQLKDVNKVLDQLKSLIIHLFKKTGCRLRDVEIILGLNIRINSKNMIVYLGLIEQKANQMLNILHYITMQEDQRNGRMLSERPDISSFIPTDVPEVGNLMPTPQDREFQTAENIADASIEARILTKEELRNLGQVDILRRQAQRKKMAFLTDNKMIKKPSQLAAA